MYIVYIYKYKHVLYIYIYICVMTYVTIEHLQTQNRKKTPFHHKKKNQKGVFK